MSTLHTALGFKIFCEIAPWRHNICGLVWNILWSCKYGGDGYNIFCDIANMDSGTIWAVLGGRVGNLVHDPLNLAKSIGQTPFCHSHSWGREGVKNIFSESFHYMTTSCPKALILFLPFNTISGIRFQYLVYEHQSHHQTIQCHYQVSGILYI